MKGATAFFALFSASLVQAGTTYLATRDDPSLEEQFYNGQVKNGNCPVYIGTRLPENDRSLEMCQEYCKDHNPGKVIACDAQKVLDTFGKFPREIDPKDYFGQYLTDPNGFPYMPVSCACDNKSVEIIAEWVVQGVAEGLEKAFGKFIEIFCGVVLPAVMTIVDIGISAIPVVGPTYRGVSTAVRVAKTFAENGLDAAEMFTGSTTPSCGNPMSFDIVSVFTNLIETPDEVGVGIGCIKNNKACKKLPKSKPENKPKGEPEDERPKDEKPKDEKPQPGSTTTADRAKETDNASKSCKLKRAPPKMYRASGDDKEKPGKPEQQRGVESVSCDDKGTTTTLQYEVTSIVWQANPTEAAITRVCGDEAGQACHHYQSAIERNPEWKTLSCPGLGASKAGTREGTSKAVTKWRNEVAKEWRDEQWRDHPNFANGQTSCQLDEFPPFYMLTKQDTAWTQGGTSMKGQLIRYMPHEQNGKGGELWKGLCFWEAVVKYDAAKFWDRVRSHQIGTSKTHPPKKDPKKGDITILEEVTIEVEYRPSLQFDFQQSDQDPAGTPIDQKIWGLRTDLNKCLPMHSLDHTGTKPFDDPGFALLRIDKFNEKRGKLDYKDTKPQPQNNTPGSQQQNSPPGSQQQNNPPGSQPQANTPGWDPSDPLSRLRAPLSAPWDLNAGSRLRREVFVA